MKIGLIVAIETQPVFKYYENPEKLDSPMGFELYHVIKNRNDVFILKTGMGEVYASCGVQFLITKFNVDVIVNFGVVGGLTEKISSQNISIIDNVVHYKYDCSEFLDLKVGQVEGHDSVYLKPDENLIKRAKELFPALPYASCASGDKFVGTKEEKESIHSKFNCDVCDMESAGIVLSCELNNVPCILLKAVADSLYGGAGEFFEKLEKASTACFEIVDKLISNFN